MIEFEE